MEQFRHIGEVLGSMKTLMVFRDNIQINQRQCCLLLDIFSFAYESIAEEMRQNLRYEEKNLKWKVLEQPLRELHKIFKEGEAYIRQCLETKDWWAKAITLYHNTDCIEFHIHNFLCSITIVIEAIETAGEFSGWDQSDVQKKKFVYLSKYRSEYKDFKLFQWKFGKQYIVTQDFCNRFDTVWKEDRWILLNKLQEMKTSCSTTYDKRLNVLLSTNLDIGSAPLYGRLLPSSILLRSRDYQVRRRLGGGSQYKEIQWLGESFAMRHFFGDIEPLVPEISTLLSLSHPNIMHFLCGFTDEEKKECFLLMELMNKDLSSYIKEVSGPRKRNSFSLSAAVDLMLQIARGMEYLHSKKIYHGDLNPSKILVKARGSSSAEGNLHAKVAGFGLSSIRNVSQKSSSNQNGTLPLIWYAPEVLEEQDQNGSAENTKYTEKSDVYSFGMVCFELLTGKVPFEDSHLQGDKMSRNIRAGERPLFPYYSPKYLTNLTKRCWHSDPNQRLSFSSICRILRCVKRFLALNPDYSSQQDPPTVPMVDYCEIESGLLRKLSSMGCSDPSPISQVPFQMFVYRVEEKERTNSNLKENSESGSDGASACGDENTLMMDDQIFSPVNERKSLASPERMNKRISFPNRSPDFKPNRQQGTPSKGRVRPPQITPCGRSMRMSSESQLVLMSPVSTKRIPRSPSGHASDSELS